MNATMDIFDRHKTLQRKEPCTLIRCKLGNCSHYMYFVDKARGPDIGSVPYLGNTYIWLSALCK